MRVGIIGAGGIAHKMAQTLSRMAEAEAYAIASRTAGKSEAFARQYGMVRAYGSYEALLEDGAVECPEMPHAETLRIMEQMDAIRAAFGIRYPFEED